jgi:hypothetical protein
MHSQNMCLLTLWAKEEKRDHFLLLHSPCLIVCCLVVLLGRMFKSCLSFKAHCSIVMVTKYLKLRLSQKIRDLFESLCFKIPGAGQSGEFPVGGRTGFVFALVCSCQHLHPSPVSWHNCSLTFISSTVHWWGASEFPLNPMSVFLGQSSTIWGANPPPYLDTS